MNEFTISAIIIAVVATTFLIGIIKYRKKSNPKNYKEHEEEQIVYVVHRDQKIKMTKYQADAWNKLSRQQKTNFLNRYGKDNKLPKSERKMI